MSDQDGGTSHPPAENQESAYPPPPGEEEDDRPRPYHHLPPPTTVTLPPIQDAPPAYGASRYPPPPDSGSRGAYSASPTLVPNTYPPSSGSPNGYHPPPGGSNGFTPGGMYTLPPVQAPDQRHYGVEPREYYPRGGSFAPPPPDSYNFAPFRPVSGPPFSGYPPDYGRGVGAPPPPQAPPRQRTSIACRYCRKRKIRCSGYSQTPDGKCINCRKTGNECIFQPVSSSSTTAFVPVSAVPGGVPPGTPLFGAFGQPLPQGASPGGQAGGAPPPSSTAGSQQPYPSENYTLPSPTASYYPPPPEDRSSIPQRRRHEEEHAPRLPPPNVYGETDARRRSPASSAPAGTPPPQYELPLPDGTGSPRRDSPNAPPPAGQQSAGPGGVMSLSSLMDHPPPRPRPSSDSSRDIDQNMLGRLNRRT
ncbi:hypothetical protein VM1G_08108 [Cytospora mali]|uniref:Zn(2)-C6 fungal-type domain-containing protein n=1 Tax=Cytospora mali TaxID=578113 RepID=A0A194W9D4_CYTMA|nr:hypothetical protein VM1G_08108 [Valsa mali]